MKILGIVCGCMAVIMLGIIVCFSYLDVMEMGAYPPAIMFVLYMTLLLLYLSVIQKIQSKPRRKTVESLVRFCSFFYVIILTKMVKYAFIKIVFLLVCFIF